ncbi:S41 family peptidase [Maritalea myrionectae]|uniref:S41 family peptidase n=1 Tax=Maritalea myrionectae TaxID=454601 RepID=UPI000420A854|nr:S41 family peptidase [Maritalea myrionectae]
MSNIALRGGLAVSAILTGCALFSMPAQANDQSVSGVWQSIGYGLWYDLGPEKARIYQVTDETCVNMIEVGGIDYRDDAITLQQATMPGVGAMMGASDFELHLQGDKLAFELGKLNPVLAERRSALPAHCATLTEGTPDATFETLWHYFDENFAFFDARQVDWQQAYDTYRPQVTADADDQALFGILQSMLAPFDDGHVSLISPVGYFTAVQKPEWAADLEEEDVPVLAQQPDAQLSNIEHHANDILVSGDLTPQIGYLRINSFEGLEDEAGGFASLSDAVDKILQRHQDKKTLVIDVRANLGGHDTAGLVVAGHFTSQVQKVFEKNVWHRGEYIELSDIAIEPQTDTPFAGDIYVLTSGLTISAAETFALAMAQLDQVQLVGEPTNGMLSDQFFAVLPNGWIATLSNEQYLSADGVQYEAVGVPVDIKVPLGASYASGETDPVLAKIKQLAGE